MLLFFFLICHSAWAMVTKLRTRVAWVTKMYCVQLCRLEVKVGIPADEVSLFLAAFFLCPHMVFPCAHCGKRELPGVSFYKDPSPLRSGLLWAHSALILSLFQTHWVSQTFHHCEARARIYFACRFQRSQSIIGLGTTQQRSSLDDIQEMGWEPAILSGFLLFLLFHVGAQTVEWVLCS
jgi:hypothetical protein